MIDVKSRWARNNGQAGTHNSPEDRDSKGSPTPMSGEKRWKPTQKRTGPPKNHNTERLEWRIWTFWAGSIALATSVGTTHWKRSTPVTTPGKLERKGYCSETTERAKRKKKAVRTRLGREWREKKHFRPGSPGNVNLGPQKPTRSCHPNDCGKRQQPRKIQPG